MGSLGAPVAARFRFKTRGLNRTSNAVVLLDRTAALGAAPSRLRLRAGRAPMGSSGAPVATCSHLPAPDFGRSDRAVVLQVGNAAREAFVREGRRHRSSGPMPPAPGVRRRRSVAEHGCAPTVSRNIANTSASERGSTRSSAAPAANAAAAGGLETAPDPSASANWRRTAAASGSMLAEPTAPAAAFCIWQRAWSRACAGVDAPLMRGPWLLRSARRSLPTLQCGAA